MTTTIATIARVLDIPFADALQACRDVGVKTFHHEHQVFPDSVSLNTYIAMRYDHDVTPELVLDLTADQALKVAKAWDVTIADLVRGEWQRECVR
jgi:hypothetical protein